LIVSNLELSKSLEEFNNCVETTCYKMNTLKFNILRSGDRGHADHGWLNSYHTFSFASYYNTNFNNYGHLRVLNEDRVKPLDGFPLHPHKNYEIFTYVVNGKMKHEDSMGNKEFISRGDVQFTTAGKGIFHSEYNASPKDELHFLQIWVKPHTMDLNPRYTTKNFSDEQKKNKFCLIVSPEGENGSININQDVKMYASIIEKGNKVQFNIDPTRQYLLHFIQSKPSINLQLTCNEKTELAQGDSIFISNPADVPVPIELHNNSTADEPVELVFFDIQVVN